MNMENKNRYSNRYLECKRKFAFKNLIYQNSKNSELEDYYDLADNIYNNLKREENLSYKNAV